MEDGKVNPVIYETDQLFLFHHINAYEEDGEIIVDVAGYNDAEVRILEWNTNCIFVKVSTTENLTN